MLFIIIACSLYFLQACSKATFENAKPNASLVIPTTLSDMQALLDNDNVMNGYGSGGVVPSVGDISATDYRMTGQFFTTSLTPLYQKYYTWATDLYNGEEIQDWDAPYQAIFYANSALDGLAKIQQTANNQTEYNNVKGSALFYRGHMFYQLAQIYAPVYDSSTAATSWGIPLQLTSSVTSGVSRATLEATYQQILSDLNLALPLLPSTPLYDRRPSKGSVYGLLARIYMNLGNYQSALNYADSCLALNNRLLDFNTIPSGNPFPFAGGKFNNEVIFRCYMVKFGMNMPISVGFAAPDSALYASYDSTDWRASIWYYVAGGGTIYPIGGYPDGNSFFAGIATDEIYLIRAECYARMGSLQNSLNDLNALLATRYKTGTYTPYTSASQLDILTKILLERRKELLYRGVRWTDLIRLNKRDPQFAVTLTRTVNGTTYTLPPNDPRYLFPVPDNVIKLNPGMPQNPR